MEILPPRVFQVTSLEWVHCFSFTALDRGPARMVDCCFLHMLCLFASMFLSTLLRHPAYDMTILSIHLYMVDSIDSVRSRPSLFAFLSVTARLPVMNIVDIYYLFLSSAAESVLIFLCLSSMEWMDDLHACMHGYIFLAPTMCMII